MTNIDETSSFDKICFSDSVRFIKTEDYKDDINAFLSVFDVVIDQIILTVAGKVLCFMLIWLFKIIS